LNFLALRTAPILLKMSSTLDLPFISSSPYLFCYRTNEEMFAEAPTSLESAVFPELGSPSLLSELASSSGSSSRRLVMNFVFSFALAYHSAIYSSCCFSNFFFRSTELLCNYSNNPLSCPTSASSSAPSSLSSRRFFMVFS